MVSVNDDEKIALRDLSHSRQSEEELNALREERKRTGRLVASGTAVFIFILGIYQALAGETPQYAALFLPAIIMFTYVGWILYASKKQKNLITVSDDNVAEDQRVQEELKEVVEESGGKETTSTTTTTKREQVPVSVHKNTFHRTYSIA